MNAQHWSINNIAFEFGSFIAAKKCIFGEFLFGLGVETLNSERNLIVVHFLFLVVALFIENSPMQASFLVTFRLKFDNTF